MKQPFYGISLLAAVLTTCILSNPATAEAQEPFKGTSSGVVRVEDVNFSDPSGLPITTTLRGVGNATHLGQFTVSTTVVINVPAGTVLGDWVLTAANGDQLFASFVGYSNGGNFTIHGGTGRFQGAAGQYVQVIAFDTDPGTLGPGESTGYTDQITGWISY